MNHEIIAVLREVMDPEVGVNVVDLDLGYEASIENCVGGLSRRSGI